MTKPEIYEKNIRTLAKYYPGLDEQIERAKEETEDITVEEEYSEDGENILRVTRDGKRSYLAGKRNAKQPPKEWLAEQGDLPEGYTYLFMGCGNMGYLRELITGAENRLTIIVYEPSLGIFRKALEQFDLEEGMKKHLIVFWVEGVGNMTLDKLDSVLERVMRLEQLQNMQLFVLPGYDVVYEDVCDKLLAKCNSIALDKRVNYNTMVKFSDVTAVNVLKNLRYLCDGYKTIQLYKAIPLDTVGIVVAAGPSLNKNIQELKKAKGKAFILAVDTAIKPLLNAGIVPDMFYIVDAEKPLDLVEIDGAENIPLATTINAAPAVLEYHKGKKFFYDEGYTVMRRVSSKSGLRWGDVGTGGSVATNAFSLLYKICLKTVILVGQDLALTGNRTHADGTFKEKMPEIDTSGCEWVEGNCEEKVPTRTDLHVFLNWYEKTIRLYKNHVKDFRVINATEGGAKIEGTEIMTLKEAIEQNCTKEVDIQECIAQLQPMLDEEGRAWAVDYLKGIPNQFLQLQKEAEKLRRQYNAVDRLCRQNKMDDQQYVALLKKIKKQSRKIEREDVYQLVNETLPTATQILRNEEFDELDSLQKDGREIARKGKLYAKLVGETSRLLREETEKVYADFA